MVEQINKAFEANDPESAKDAVYSVIKSLTEGTCRVAQRVEQNWVVNEWVKKAILMYFRLKKMKSFKAGDLNFYDKIDVRRWSDKDGVRVVPHAVVREGAFVEKGAVLMPSYINIGAYVGAGTMVDTWATVGSCAQVGENVHLSGGVGLGGVLEPTQARPVIVEDNVFVGSRCIIVEGVLIREGAVIGAGVTITSSTPIIDVRGESPEYIKGEVPSNAIVIPGTRKKEFPSGEFFVPCALIIGERNKNTDKKTSLNQALRDFGVQV